MRNKAKKSFNFSSRSVHRHRQSQTSPTMANWKMSHARRLKYRPCTAEGLAVAACVEGLSAVFRPLGAGFTSALVEGVDKRLHRVGKATLIVEVAAVLLIIGLYRSRFLPPVFVLTPYFPGARW